MGAEGQGWLVGLTGQRERNVLAVFDTSGAWMLNKTARNERRKLTAAFLNALSSGTVLAAVVVPFIGLGLGTVQPNTDILNVAGLTGFGITVAIVVHLIARGSLKGLEE